MFTTYFSNTKKLGEEYKLFSIARKTPEGFKGTTIPQLFPSWELLSKYKQDGNSEYYTEKYNEQLSKLDANKLAEAIGDNGVLVCYEGIGKFCHRHLVALWFMEHGVMVQELRL